MKIKIKFNIYDSDTFFVPIFSTISEIKNKG